MTGSRRDSPGDDDAERRPGTPFETDSDSEVGSEARDPSDDSAHDSDPDLDSVDRTLGAKILVVLEKGFVHLVRWMADNGRVARFVFQAMFFVILGVTVLVAFMHAGTVVTEQVNTGNISSSVNTSLPSYTMVTGNVTVVNATAIRVEGDGNTTVVTDDTVLVPAASPESVSPSRFGFADTEANRTCLAAWGQEANHHAKTVIVPNETIGARVMNTSREAGPFPREYVLMNGTAFGKTLVRNGYAAVQSYQFVNRTGYVSLQQAAKNSSRGLWGCPSNRP